MVFTLYVLSVFLSRGTVLCFFGQRVCKSFFLSKLRDEEKFPNIEALIQQIKQDCEQASVFFQNNQRDRDEKRD